MWETVLGWFGLQRRVNNFSAQCPPGKVPDPAVHIGGSSGNNVQVGYADGDVRIEKRNSTHNHSHAHQHGMVIVVNASSAAAHSPPVPVLEDFHVELLGFMAQNPNYKEHTQRFMQREFGTTRVQHLDRKQCHRATRYMEVCINRDAEKIATEVSQH